jgi:hypothetical protein
MDLVEKIIDLAAKNYITAYKISKHTSISINTVRSVLKNSEINTKPQTLHIILDYLEKEVAGTAGDLEGQKKYSTKNIRNTTKEDDPEIILEFQDLKINDQLNIIYEQNLENLKKTDVISKTLLKISLKLRDLEKKKKLKNHKLS